MIVEFFWSKEFGLYGGVGIDFVIVNLIGGLV